jgi:hypothetical protein
MFIVFAIVSHWSLSTVSGIESISSHPVCQINFSIIFPSKHRSAKFSLFFRFSYKNFVFPVASCVLHVPPNHHPWFNHSSNSSPVDEHKLWTSSQDRKWISNTLPPFSLFPALWSIQHPWNALFHFSFLILRQSVGLLERGISLSQGRYLYKHSTNTDKHPCLEWDSKPRSQRSSGRRQFMP